MQTKIYNATPIQIATFRSQLATLGTTLPVGNFGQFTPPGHSEITLSFAYDGVAKLTLTILHDAWYENCDEIWSKIDTYLPQ